MHVPDYLVDRVLPGQRQTLLPLLNVLEQLGHPERAVPTVLIGGTNGKGSTQAFLETTLRAGGYRVGAFTSPSLEDFHELIRLEGAPLSETIGRQLADTVLRISGERGLTLFEMATTMAFLAFRELQPDIAVVEVGLGGRRDATNVCDPLVSVLTSVALDHQRELGSTLESIALEKAAIARSGRPLLAAASGEALATLKKACATSRARLEVLDSDFHLTEEGGPEGHEQERVASEGDRSLVFRSGDRMIGRLRLGLAGPHQRANAALAIQAALKLEGCGFFVSDTAIRSGLHDAYVPGRLEWMVGADGTRVLVDGAHNPHGTSALKNSIRAMAPERPRNLGFAVYDDKDVLGMLEDLLPIADRLYCTRTKSPRCLPPETVAEIAGSLAPPGVRIAVFPSIKEVVDEFRRHRSGSNILCGSLSVIQEARRAICSPCSSGTQADGR